MWFFFYFIFLFLDFLGNTVDIPCTIFPGEIVQAMKKSFVEGYSSHVFVQGMYNIQFVLCNVFHLKSFMTLTINGMEVF